MGILNYQNVCIQNRFYRIKTCKTIWGNVGTPSLENKHYYLFACRTSKTNLTQLCPLKSYVIMLSFNTFWRKKDKKVHQSPHSEWCAPNIFRIWEAKVLLILQQLFINVQLLINSFVELLLLEKMDIYILWTSLYTVIMYRLWLHINYAVWFFFIRGNWNMNMTKINLYTKKEKLYPSC